MKNLHLLEIGAICTMLFLLQGCEKHFEETAENLNVVQYKDEICISKVLMEDVVYHDQTQSWIKYQADPYSLENMQKAYDRIRSNKSLKSQFNAIASEFSEIKKLEPTHYCLKIFPKNEDEQWVLEQMEDIKVSYVPFDYVQLPDDEQTKRMVANISVNKKFTEENSYSVVYDSMCAVGASEPIMHELKLPILYVVWPCEKPLPNNFDYELDYSVFLPDKTGEVSKTALSVVANRLLESEAIGLVTGDVPVYEKLLSSDTRSTASNDITLRGQMCVSDDLLDKYVPLCNMKIRFQLGSNIWDAAVNSIGYFTITAPIPTTATFTSILHTSDYKITSMNTTSPLSFSHGTVGSVWSDLSVTIFRGFYANGPSYTAFRAANEYFNGAHYPSWACSKELRIRTTSQYMQNGILSNYYYNNKGEYYITVYNIDMEGGYPIDNTILGATLHEIGHYSQYLRESGYNGFSKVDDLLAESFASFIGWHIGEKYYLKLGYVRETTRFDDIVGQARQSWAKTDPASQGGVYSPLFVDLVDDYNQTNLNDQIKDFPIDVIWELEGLCRSWSMFKSELQKYVGVYYTASELNNYISAYDYWYANN